MNKLDRFIKETVKKSQKVERDAEGNMISEGKNSAYLSEYFDKTKDPKSLMMSIVHGGNRNIFHDIQQLALLMQMNLAIMGMMNLELQQLGKKHPQTKSKIEHDIAKKFDPLIKKFVETQQIEDDINSMAKDREDKVSDMFG